MTSSRRGGSARRLRIDADASEVQLEATQFGLVKHRCRFTEFHGALALTNEGDLSSASLTIAAGSLASAFGSKLDQLAANLLLQAERHPWIKVSSGAVRRAGAGAVPARLTLRGRTGEVPLRVQVGRVEADGSVSFTVAATVDRREWGSAEDLPGFRIGNQVSIKARMRAVPD